MDKSTAVGSSCEIEVTFAGAMGHACCCTPLYRGLAT
jgi:hypothetical protein